MERVRQIVGANGLQIPLPIMQQYGYSPGTSVVLELEMGGIRVLPTAFSKAKIENMALRTLLTQLGDAVTVTARQVDDGWQVLVYGAELVEALGELFYTWKGELLSDRSTPIQTMRLKVMEVMKA